MSAMSAPLSFAWCNMLTATLPSPAAAHRALHSRVSSSISERARDMPPFDMYVVCSWLSHRRSFPADWPDADVDALQGAAIVVVDARNTWAHHPNTCLSKAGDTPSCTWTACCAPTCAASLVTTTSAKQSASATLVACKHNIDTQCGQDVAQFAATDAALWELARALQAFNAAAVKTCRSTHADPAHAHFKSCHACKGRAAPCLGETPMSIANTKDDKLKEHISTCVTTAKTRSPAALHTPST